MYETSVNCKDLPGNGDLSHGDFNLTGAGEAERLRGEIVGDGYFPVPA